MKKTRATAGQVWPDSTLRHAMVLQFAPAMMRLTLRELKGFESVTKVKMNVFASLRVKQHK